MTTPKLMTAEEAIKELRLLIEANEQELKGGGATISGFVTAVLQEILRNTENKNN